MPNLNDFKVEELEQRLEMVSWLDRVNVDLSTPCDPSNSNPFDNATNPNCTNDPAFGGALPDGPPFG